MTELIDHQKDTGPSMAVDPDKLSQGEHAEGWEAPRGAQGSSLWLPWKEEAHFPGTPTCGPRNRQHYVGSSRVSSWHSTFHHPQAQRRVVSGMPWV